MTNALSLLLLLASPSSCAAAQQLVFQTGVIADSLIAPPFFGQYNFSTKKLEMVALPLKKQDYFQYTVMAPPSKASPFPRLIAKTVDGDGTHTISSYNALTGAELAKYALPKFQLGWSHCGLFFDASSDVTFLQGCIYANEGSWIEFCRVDMVNGATTLVGKLKASTDPGMTNPTPKAIPTGNPQLYYFLWSGVKRALSISGFDASRGVVTQTVVATGPLATDDAGPMFFLPSQGHAISSNSSIGIVTFDPTITYEQMTPLDVVTGISGQKNLWRFPDKYSSGVWKPAQNTTHIFTLVPGSDRGLKLSILDLLTGAETETIDFGELPQEHSIGQTFVVRS
jgi:hypothetical protein